jgi:hypothetical protein
MELVVRAARGGTGGYWLRSLFAQSWWPSKTEVEDRDAPAVLARSFGAEYVLLRTGTRRQAERARDRLQQELDHLGETEFRRRYGLPPVPH